MIYTRREKFYADGCEIDTFAILLRNSCIHWYVSYVASPRGDSLRRIVNHAVCCERRGWCSAVALRVVYKVRMFEVGTGG